MYRIYSVANKLTSSDFGVFDFTQDLAVVGDDNVYFETIILVNNVALDHGAAGKPDDEGFLWRRTLIRSAPDDNIALNLRSLCERDVPVDRFQVTSDDGFCESDGPVNCAQRSVNLRSRFAANPSVDGACITVDGGVRTDLDLAIDGMKFANLTVISHGDAAINGSACSSDSASVSNGDSCVDRAQRTLVRFAAANPGRHAAGKGEQAQ